MITNADVAQIAVLILFSLRYSTNFAGMEKNLRGMIYIVPPDFNTEYISFTDTSKSKGA